MSSGTPKQQKPQTIRVTGELVQQFVRLDRLLAHTLGVGRRAVGRLLQQGLVSLNGRTVRRTMPLQGGDCVTVTVIDVASLPIVDQPLALLYVDEDIVVVDKPPAISSVGQPGGDRDTVAGRLLRIFPEMFGIAGRSTDGGMIHRLDRETTGLMIAARHGAAHRSIRHQFRQRTVCKGYVAWVDGRPAGDEGWITHRLEPIGKRGSRMRVTGESRGVAALSWYRVLESTHGQTLLAVFIVTGVRHQVRVHLAGIGHPIVGDRLYGTSEKWSARLLLHAWYLEVCHPKTHRRIWWKSLPDEVWYKPTTAALDTLLSEKRIVSPSHASFSPPL